MYELQKEDGSGAHVFNALALGSDGRLYGTTSPNAGNAVNYCGTVFAVNPGTGAYQTLHVFADIGSDGKNADGCKPVGGVGFGPDGRAYGTTARGGSAAQGTLWSIDTAGSNFVKLHDEDTVFDGTGHTVDGYEPGSKMERVGSDGMYFVAQSGIGTLIDRWNISTGTVTKIALLDPAAVGTGGSTPVIDSSGMLRGFTTNKTTDPSGSASGGFYVINPANGVVTSSVAFPVHAVQTADTNTSYAGATYMPDGTTWVVLPTGGSANWGWIARLDAGGSNASDLYDFKGSGFDSLGRGYEPICTPVIGYDGLVYGTTVYGGSNVDVAGRHLFGMVWQIATDGTGFKDIFDFTNPSGSADPGANAEIGFTVGSNGDLYGATYEGGSNGVGAIYELGGCDDWKCY